tara:strand:- start:396 stop:1256 length:861 start_codon:yes stop_codon:yes gene_type:complete
MFRNFSKIFYYLVKIIDKLIFFLSRRSIISNFKDFINNDSYKSINIEKKEIKFFIPNTVTEWRVDTLLSKEPETIKWIDEFGGEKKIFWDIGANIGIYSIYAVVKHQNIDVVSFEPSFSNLRTLSRNISINNLEDRITIFQLPLSNTDNKFQMMEESEFIEGWSMNSFGTSLNFEGKDFKSKNKYKIYGSSINKILKDGILKKPNFLKIDVDGIEHLILEGAHDYLADKELTNILVEINENFKNQFEGVLSILKKSNFKFIEKKQSKELANSKEFNKTFNYFFKKV